MAIQKILITQPNYAWLGKRPWRFPPYTLCLLKAAMPSDVETEVFDPNLNNVSEDEVKALLKRKTPDLIGISSISTEHFASTRHMVRLIRETLPKTIIVLGGVIHTVMLDEAMFDTNSTFAGP